MPPGSRSRILLTASLVSSLIMLDSNIVAVSLPAIGRSLGATFTEVQWVIDAYILTYASLLLAAGNYADLHGRRLSMLIGLAVFSAASAACGMATTSLALNLARAAQGVGGAFLLTASLAVLSNTFTGPERNRALAFWGASLGIALAVGPVVGGLITEYAGWRWIFLLNIPASVALIVATMTFIGESRDPNARRLDLAGTLTFSAALALLIWALIDGNRAGWGSVSIVGRLIASGVFLVAFLAVETRQQRPMVDLGLFREQTFVGAAVAMIGYGASAQVMIFFLPLYLENAYDFVPLAAGLAMLPFALPMVLAPRVIGQLTARYSGRVILTGGLVITAAGNAAFWLAAFSHQPYPVFVAAMLLAGCGAGILNGQTVKILQGAVPASRAGMASGIASTTRFIGILVSVAALGAVLSSVTQTRFLALAPLGHTASEATRALAARIAAGDLAGVIALADRPLQPALHAAAVAAYADGFAATALGAAALALGASLFAFTLISPRETAPETADSRPRRPRKVIDCRDPL